jgi:hypothetical protein
MSTSPRTIEEAKEPSPALKISKGRIEALKLIRQERLRVIDARGLSPEIQRNRIDCLLFFHVIQFGWGPARKTISRNGKASWVAYDVPASRESRFGYPDRGRIDGACAKIRRLCPEAKEYQKAFARFLQASELYMAARTKKSYSKHLAGEPSDLVRVNPKSQQNIRRRRTRVEFINTLIKERIGLKRIAERDFAGTANRKLIRKRAQQVIMEATAEMARCRAAIFDTMQVPEQFRSLA